MPTYEGTCRGGIWDGRFWSYDEPIFDPDEMDADDGPHSFTPGNILTTAGQYRHDGGSLWIWHLHRE